MNNNDCLIVEDEKDLADSIQSYFGVFGIKADCAYSIESAQKHLENTKYRIVLMDINLPDGSGYNLCRELKCKSDVLVHFISARGEDDDIICAYGVGASDYTCKPFSLAVLYAKVSSMLKRKESKNDVVLDKAAMTVAVGGTEIKLKLMEFKLLDYLMKYPNIVLDKEKIFDEVWAGVFSENTLNVHIKKLRDKIEKDSKNPQRIVTVWGVGYKFCNK